MFRVEAAVDEFNRYRSPECVAELVSFEGKKVVVEFKGCFCYSCGCFDYVDDFGLMLRDHGLRTVVDEVERVDEGLRVVFVVK